MRHRALLRLSLIIGSMTCMLVIVVWQLATTQAQGGSCTVGTYLQETLPTGARWDLCWNVRAQEGVVLAEVHYSPPGGVRRKVLHEASLAQIEVSYDDGRANFYFASDPGLGDSRLLTLSAGDCPSGVLLAQNGRSVLCKQIAARGYLNKYYAQQRQGDEFTLFSASQIGQHLYIVQWRFLDDGTIEPQVGDGGRLLRLGRDPQVGWPLTADGTIGIGFITNYWWRLDFDIGGNGANDNVEEFEVTSTNANTTKVAAATLLTSEIGRTIDPNKKRSWRVRDATLKNSDGHAISYHIDAKDAGYRHVGTVAQPWSQYDLYVTVANSCEVLAIQNPTAGGCADNVAGFVNGQSIVNTDVVVWYRVTTHRLPRIEDTPLIDIEWHGFQLWPRDWSAQSPF